MATRKPPYLRTQHSKENFITNNKRFEYDEPKVKKRERKDISTVEVQLDRNRIYCRSCKEFETIPADTKFQTSDENRRAGHSDLRKLIEKFKQNHSSCMKN